MNEHLRDRILRKLETLPDERAYQILDYVEFLSSKYAERPAPVTQNVFTRFTEAVEDRLRAGKVSSAAITETMNLMNRAVKVLDGVTAAGRSVATDLASAASDALSSVQRPSGGGQEPPVPPAPSGSGPGAPGSTDSGEVNPPGAPSAGEGGTSTNTGTSTGGRA